MKCKFCKKETLMLFPNGGCLICKDLVPPVKIVAKPKKKKSKRVSDRQRSPMKSVSKVTQSKTTKKKKSEVNVKRVPLTDEEKKRRRLEYMAKYRAENRERINAYARGYYAENLPDENRKKQKLDAYNRWLNKPGNREVHNRRSRLARRKKECSKACAADFAGGVL